MLASAAYVSRRTLDSALCRAMKGANERGGPSVELYAKDREQKNCAGEYDAHNCTQRAHNLDRVKLHWATLVGDARCL